jgi:predicted O-methyltransferase YrrM
MLPLFMQKFHNRLNRRLWGFVPPGPLLRAAKRDERVAAQIASYEREAGAAHGCGSLPLRTLIRIENMLRSTSIVSAETGCGKSTIFLSRIAKRHKVFCIDDRDRGEESSVAYFMNCAATRHEVIETVFGPTQLTLPGFADHEPYDLVLIDGPHGFPFPDLEYYYFYRHLKVGGLLVIDDVHIPTIGRLVDFIAEDRMFETVEFIGPTVVFRRTDAPVFDPMGDDWWLQDYNRRRADFAKEILLVDGKRREPLNFEGRF